MLIVNLNFFHITNSVDVVFRTIILKFIFLQEVTKFLIIHLLVIYENFLRLVIQHAHLNAKQEE